MNGVKQLPVILAAVWMFIQLLLFYLETPKYFEIGIYFNLFFILTVVVLTMFFQIQSEKKLHPFAVNFKNCLKNAGKYFLLVTVFLYCFFKFIDPGFLGDIREARITTEESKDWEQVKASSPIFENMTREEYLEKARASNEMLSSVSLNVSFYFLGMFFMSLFYSILVPLFYKKVVLRM